ncbi:hypothetical protein CCHR01_18063 [Colletotrichum chrysophilum]|uniref:Uncharacterized protein n=1 Tax=Colletotrichum chrysophilum TaxID=1836956 RepID=A0AAD9E8H9_9PEZI|nr:hypothetical protein CCHR01_18063 [Colletotrichum chrysophilum]
MCLGRGLFVISTEHTVVVHPLYRPRRRRNSSACSGSWSPSRACFHCLLFPVLLVRKRLGDNVSVVFLVLDSLPSSLLYLFLKGSIFGLTTLYARQTSQARTHHSFLFHSHKPNSLVRPRSTLADPKTPHQSSALSIDPANSSFPGLPLWERYTLYPLNLQRINCLGVANKDRRPCPSPNASSTLCKTDLSPGKTRHGPYAITTTALFLSTTLFCSVAFHALAARHRSY